MMHCCIYRPTVLYDDLWLCAPSLPFVLTRRGLGRLGAMRGSVAAALGDEVRRRGLARFSWQGICNLLAAFSKSSSEESQWLFDAAEEVLDARGALSLSPQDIANLLWSCASSKCKSR